MAMRSAANIASIAINAAAALFGIVGFGILIGMAESGDVLATVSVYGITLVLAYSTSALYHGARGGERGPIFQAADHCTIYLLIAGTYTPFAVLALRDRQGPLLLGAVWILAFAGIVIRIFWIRRLHRLSPALYVLLGWIGLAWARPFVETLDRSALVLLIAGGLAYTAGAAFFSRSASARGDVLWHVCAVAGSACHYAAVVRLLSRHGV